MIIVNFLLSLFFWIYLQVFIFILALISYPAALLPGQGKGLIYSLVKVLLKIIFFICFVRVKISGVENLPRKKRLILVSNKPNLMAPLSVIVHFPLEVRFVAAKKMFLFPLLGRVVRALGSIAAAEEKKDIFRFAGTILTSLRENEPVLFYPENLRRSDGKIGTFQLSEIRVAELCEAAIVPLVLVGSEKILPHGGALLSPGEIKIVIGEPIPPGDPQAVAQKLQEIYASFSPVDTI